MTFPEALTALMEQKGLKVKELADASGVSADFIYKILRGERTGITAETLFALCDVLGVGCEYFRPYLAKSPTVAPEIPKGKRK